jgi:hypothetical protein
MENNLMSDLRNHIIQHKQPAKFEINGNLVVQGDIIVKGTSSITDIQTTNKALQEENTQLTKRLEDLEAKLDMLWYAPGMPGYIVTMNHYVTTNQK